MKNNFQIFCFKSKYLWENNIKNEEKCELLFKLILYKISKTTVSSGFCSMNSLG